MNEKELQIINQQEIFSKQFRVYGEIDNPLFLAKDVAECIEHSDVSTMIRSIDEEEKLTQTMFVSGQNREMWFLTENGLYEVLFQSRKPIAKVFKKEVKNVLKTMRQSGGFIASPTKMVDTYFGTLPSDMKTIVEGLFTQIQNQQTALRLQQPKVDFYNDVMESETTCDMAKTAKILANYGLGRNKLFEVLRENKILRYNNEPYQLYIDNGWFRVIESKFTKPNGDIQVNFKTVVFQKGIDGIRKLLEKLGYEA
ncbi:MAG: phage antirepressor KilAC domain-containing protein [Oscillospiraceae bacterium]